MKRQHVIALTLAALVIGIFAGAGVTSEIYRRDSAHDSLVHTEVTLAKDLLVLKKLQAGLTDEAKELLEQGIDSGVVGVDTLKKEHVELSRETYSTLPAISVYRSSVPRILQNTEFAQRVSKILESAKDEHLTADCTRTRDDQASPCSSRAGGSGR